MEVDNINHPPHYNSSKAECFGVIQEMEEQQHRYPLDGFAEIILAQVDRRISQRLSECRVEFQESQLSLYKKAFLEGIREGLNMRRDIDEDY